MQNDKKIFKLVIKNNVELQVLFDRINKNLWTWTFFIKTWTFCINMWTFGPTHLATLIYAHFSNGNIPACGKSIDSMKAGDHYHKSFKFRNYQTLEFGKQCQWTSNTRYLQGLRHIYKRIEVSYWVSNLLLYDCIYDVIIWLYN